MGFLVSDVTALVRDHMSDFPPDSSALALQLVNFAQSDIVRACRVYPTVEFKINLVNGQQTYPLDDTVVRIWRAYWWIAPQNGIRIYETSIDELDDINPAWLNLSPANQAYRYYEDGRNLGLVPPPNIDSPVSGYPYVKIYCATQHQFATVSDPLPTFLTQMDAWVWGSCARWAAIQRRSDADYFADLAAGARTDLVRLVNGTLVRQKPQVRAAYSNIRNR